MVSFAELADITKREKRKECLNTLYVYATHTELEQEEVKEIERAYNYLRRSI